MIKMNDNPQEIHSDSMNPTTKQERFSTKEKAVIIAVGILAFLILAKAVMGAATTTSIYPENNQTIKFKTFTANFTFNETVTITSASLDGNAIALSGGPTLFTYTVASPLTEGSHTFSITAKDAADNTITQNIPFNIDASLAVMNITLTGNFLVSIIAPAMISMGQLVLGPERNFVAWHVNDSYSNASVRVGLPTMTDPLAADFFIIGPTGSLTKLSQLRVDVPISVSGDYILRILPKKPGPVPSTLSIDYEPSIVDFKIQ